MNLNIRFPRSIWQEHLIGMENYSEFCRDAIIEKITYESSNKFIDTEIERFQDKIKELKEKKKSKPTHEKEIHEFLEYHSHNYKQNSLHRSDAQRFNFIEKAILPNLIKYGSKKTAQEVDDILLNWPEEKKND